MRARLAKAERALAALRRAEAQRAADSERARARERELGALHQLSEIALAAQPRSRMLQAAVQVICASTGFPIVAIEDYDAERQLMTFAAATGLPAAPDPLQIAVDQTLSGVVAQSGQPLVEPNAQARSEYTAAPLRRLGVQTFVCAPMIVKGQVLGTLALAHPERVALDAPFVSWVCSLANVIAVMIERVRAEEQLQASARQSRAILDKLAAGVVLLDTDGRYHFANQRAAGMFGLSPAEVVGKSLFDLLPFDVAQAYLERNRRFIAAEEVAEYEASFDLPVGKRTFFIADQVLTDCQGAGALLLSNLIDITARTQAEAALRLSEERFAKAFHGSPVALSISRLDDSTIVAVNRSFLDLYGYVADEVLGRTTIDLHIFANLDDRRDIVRHLLDQGSGATYEMTTLTQAREERIVLLSVEPITIDGAAHLLSARHDITARVRAERALSESERKLRTLMDLLPVGVSVLDAERRITFMNPALEQTLAMSHAELLRGSYQTRRYLRSDGTAMPPAEFASARAIAEQRAIEQVETGVLTETGRLIWTSVSAVPVAFSDWSVVIVTSDITARKHAEAALRESQQNLETLIENTDGSIWSVDSAYRLIVGNRLYHQHVSAALGRPVSAGECVLALELPQAALDEWHAYYDRAMRDGAFSVETITRFTEVPRTVEYRLSPITTPTGQVAGVTAFGRDITERKQAEAALHQTLEELTRSNADLEQFAYVASHDLQEPLRAVSGMVQLLRQRYEGQLDARADQYISLAVEAAARMQALINDLLAYSRVQRHGKPFVPVAAAAVLEAALANLAVAVQESGAEITRDALPTVRADAAQLTQLFQNLIGNAIKFRGEAPPRIHISATRRAAAWCFAVRDNGIGIAPDYFERIFVIFQRLHPRRAYPGTGVGLALCKKIVERHGGQIWLESHLEHGTTFFFTLPDRS